MAVRCRWSVLGPSAVTQTWSYCPDPPSNRLSYSNPTSPGVTLRVSIRTPLQAYGEYAGCNYYGQDLSNQNLTGASLFFSQFTFATLKGTNLTNADLTYANLYAADLTGATLSGATLTGTYFCKTVMPDGTQNNSSC